MRVPTRSPLLADGADFELCRNGGLLPRCPDSHSDRCAVPMVLTPKVHFYPKVRPGAPASYDQAAGLMVLPMARTPMPSST